MTRLIVVGPLPPPYHGVTVSTSLVLANPVLRERFTIEHLDTSDHRSGQNVGRWDLANLAGATAAVFRLARRLSGEQGIVYLPLSQGLPGLTRDTLFIRLAAARRWKVAAHLRGSEIGGVYRSQGAPVRAWLRSAFKRLDSVAVLGESLRPVFKGLVASEQISIVPNGTPDPGPPAPTSNGELGVFLGNFRRRKGIVEALQAALLVVDRRPSAHFVFAGESRDSSLAGELRRLASRANGQIELRDPVTGADKQQLLCSAAFVLFPSVEPEGHPRVVLEAIAAGVPVVATDRGAIAETIVDGESGYVLPDPEPEQLAERMLRLLEDPKLQASMRKAARSRYLARFTQETADRALAEWLTNLARPSRELGR